MRATASAVAFARRAASHAPPVATALKTTVDPAMMENQGVPMRRERSGSCTNCLP